MRTLATAALVATLAAAAAASGAGADGHLLLQRGVALHREAAYPASVTALELALQSRALDGAELLECRFYLGADYVALGSHAAARRELRLVVDADPSYELPPYTSPKVVALFREVREEAEHAPRLKALPPRRPSTNRLEIAFDPSRTNGVAYGAARWRWRGERGWREAALGHDGDRLVAPLELDRNGTIEYFAEARAPAGAAQAGTIEHPLELPVSGVVLAAAPAPPPRKSVLTSWWLWTAVGAVAVTGLGVGLYFAFSKPAAPTADAVLTFTVR